MRFSLPLFCLAIGLQCQGNASAEERILPSPRITIYPGDVIEDSMLEERSFRLDGVQERTLIETRAAVVGKVARRTLLPHLPVAATAVDNPHIVALGARVKIVFSEHGLIITAFGTAMQTGAAGDLIRVRNQDSGSMIMGRVQSDGSIRVSEG